MVEISKSGSGEGLGGVIPRGYSKTRARAGPGRGFIGRPGATRRRRQTHLHGIMPVTSVPGTASAVAHPCGAYLDSSCQA